MFLDKDVLEDIKEFAKYYERVEFTIFLESLLPYVTSKRHSYVNYKGEVVSKKINFALVAAYLLDKEKDNKLYLETLYENVWKTETKKIKKIDRFSAIEKEECEEKLFKTMQKGELTFALRYAKELLLKDKELFYKTVLFYSMINDVTDYNCIYAMVGIQMIENLGSRKNYIFPLFLMVSFLSTEAGEFCTYKKVLSVKKINGTKYDVYINNIYENIEKFQGNKDEMKRIYENFKEIIANKKYSFDTKHGQKILTYSKNLQEYIEKYHDEKSPILLLKGYFMLCDMENVEDQSLETQESKLLKSVYYNL